MDIFIELSLIITVAALFSILMKVLRQPLVVGYILTGIAVGPYFFNVVQDTEYLELFSKIGISVLLFIVGLSLSPKIIKNLGKVSLITGLGQIIFTVIVGYILILALNINPLPGFYIAVALTFSSTIIILKLLSDKGDINKLYGRISVGFLIVQDIIAAIILVLISAFYTTGNTAHPSLYLVAIKSLIAFFLLYVTAKYIIPYLGRIFASSQETLFLFSISWGLGISSIFYSIGFSMEIGALVAGVVLSTTPFCHEISAKMKPLRDFFILIFFILLGSQMTFANSYSLLFPAIVLSSFILIGNPIIMITIMNLIGYKRKTAYLAGLTVAQISEFSLILMSLGAQVGHVGNDHVSLVTLIGLITIAGSSYLIIYADSIYPKVEWLVKILEFRDNKEEVCLPEKSHEIILFGYDRVGKEFIESFKSLNRNFLAVDFNPSSISRLKEENIDSVYGDAEDSEFLEELPLSEYKMIVSTIPDFKTNYLLTQSVRKINDKAIILVISHNIHESEKLYEAGATYVIMPHHLGAKHAADMIRRHGLDNSLFEKEKENHISSLSLAKILN